jgi:hypothetical protein
MDSTTQKLLSRHSRRKKKCSTGIQTRVSSTGPFCDSPPLVVLTASDAFSYKNERAPTCSKSKRQQKEGEKDDMMEGSALLSLAKAEAEGRDIFGARDVQRKTTFHRPTSTICVCTGRHTTTSTPKDRHVIYRLWTTLPRCLRRRRRLSLDLAAPLHP